jgi:hypothetical protein
MENRLRQKEIELQAKAEEIQKAIEVWEKKLQEAERGLEYIKSIEDWQRRDDLFFEKLRERDEQQEKGEL